MLVLAGTSAPALAQEAAPAPALPDTPPAPGPGGDAMLAPEQVDETEGEEGTPGRIGCLDDLSEEGYRRKGVQKRDFLKAGRFELSGLGGFYASDLLSSTYTAAGSASYFPVEDFGVELLVSWAPVQFRLERPFTAFDGTRRFESSAALQIMGGLSFAPFHAKFKLTEKTILHGDLFGLAGAGRTFHDSVQGVSFQAGLGLRLYLMRRLAFRLEVRDFILPQEVLGRGRVTHNLTILGGLGLWLL